ncbi:MAG: porin family protein [Opitutae bacterium]|nr:porin family protein [Opitutae bacterium]
MKNVTSFKTLILAGAVALGFATAAVAGEGPAEASAPAVTGRGLLGQSYVNLGYSFVDLQGTGIDAQGVNFELNQNVREGVDTLLSYNYLRSDSFAGGRIKQNTLVAGGRFYTSFRGFKPYAEAGLGWTWLRAPLGFSDDSFTYFAGVGAEFQVTPDVTVTPFIRYIDATTDSVDHEWNYGVRANWWATEKIGLTAAVIRDNSRNMEYNIGVNYRF